MNINPELIKSLRKCHKCKIPEFNKMDESNKNKPFTKIEGHYYCDFCIRMNEREMIMKNFMAEAAREKN